MKKLSFQRKQIVIVCHDSVTGPPHMLRDYVIAHGAKNVIFIGHQNRYVPNNPVKFSYVEIFLNGKKTLVQRAPMIQLFEPIAYIKDFFLTFYWIFKYQKGKIDYFIGLGNLNALNGLLLKKFGFVRNDIYYVIDYAPKRFGNSLMNNIYHAVDYICAMYTRSTWNYAAGMIQSRNSKWNKVFPHQQIVPNGVVIDPNLKKPAGHNRFELVYLGSLFEQQGILFVVEAMSLLAKKIPKVHLTIIGMGPLRETIEKRISELHLQNYIRLTGFLSSLKDTNNVVSQASLGIAMYNPDIGFVRYTEPGKVKHYLSCSVPVIMTDVSPLVTEVVKHDCGFCCKYKMENFVQTVCTYLNNPQRIKEFKKNSLAFVRPYSWERIFTQAFHSV